VPDGSPPVRDFRGPVQDSPLALCDARSFTDADLIASDLVYAHVRGETSRVAYNPAHHWYYFSDMQPDEVLFIRVHDSSNDGRARPSFHDFGGFRARSVVWCWRNFCALLEGSAPKQQSIDKEEICAFR
jgi:hypothetical protein